ncbi:MAG: hemerythrin domain-containing protein [Thermoproteota archaeon]
MKATDILEEEHRIIEKGIMYLDFSVEAIRNKKEVKKEEFSKVLDFFSTFADKCHHLKEEKVLFPLLELRGILKEGGPIGVMLFEHEEGRKLVREMKEAFNSERKNTITNEQIAILASNYAEHLRSHIWKEENILFKLANEVLLEEDDEKIVSLFEEYEEKEVGYEKHKHYVEMINQLSAKIKVL